MTASASSSMPSTSALNSTLYLLGAGVMLLAVITHLWALDLSAVFGWLERAFGPVFITLYLGLTAIGVVAVSRLETARPEAWRETAEQAAGGIATLALTFTLLGISLGIESLSNSELSPETIQTVIGELTRHFSTAFLTTIVGLPTASALRAAVGIRWAIVKQRRLESARSVQHD